ncbi:MAG: hypothetical protein CFE21_12295 [Bacteroidetes bacterium B1(2017)]|nr:MAG: hypothetical protein CFE21_12295 [Bacteroidetes bacterium B1(2017)]
MTKSAKRKAEEDDFLAEEKSKLLEQVFGVIYLIFIIGITLCVLMELKMEYQIDIFPGVDTPFDDIYRGAKNTMSGNPNPPPPPHD